MPVSLSLPPLNSRLALWCSALLVNSALLMGSGWFEPCHVAPAQGIMPLMGIHRIWNKPLPRPAMAFESGRPSPMPTCRTIVPSGSQRLLESTFQRHSGYEDLQTMGNRRPGAGQSKCCCGRAMTISGHPGDTASKEFFVTIKTIGLDK